MKISKPKYWNNRSLISIILLPISTIFEIFVFLRSKFIKPRSFDIPIICVGNIYVGGTGKTPTSLFLANKLKKKGKNPVIVRKFYKEHRDEYELIKKYFSGFLTNKKRSVAIEESIIKGYDSVILDDGMQDYKIKKNLIMVCFNQNQMIGNGFVFPSGPLRENLKALTKAEIVLLNGKKNIQFEELILNVNKNLKIFYSNYKPMNLDIFKKKDLCVVSGIGNPENFIQLLKSHELKISREFNFPDHYEFKKDELLKIIDYAKNSNLQVITTEKDFCRLKKYNLEGIDYLRVELTIDQEDLFLESLLHIYD